MHTWTVEDIRRLEEMHVHASDGKRIGAIKEVYYDEQTNEPEWLGVETASKVKAVPLSLLIEASGHLVLPFTREEVDSEPDFHVEEQHIDAQDGAKLRAYFGLEPD
jgi:hypothetical protein